MKWMIALDSSGDLQEGMPLAPDTALVSVPLTIQIGGMSFVDEAGLDIRAMMDAMQSSDQPTSSACPSPDAWARAFQQADHVFAITISSKLSGSYNSAMIARDLVLEQYPEKKIAVIDSQATSGSMILMARLINDMIAQGAHFEKIEDAVLALRDRQHILFTLSSFDNLVRNGRMPKLVGVLAKTMKMRIIGAGVEGQIQIIHKCRGEQNTLMTLIKDMKACGDLARRHVVITHCFNLKLAKTLENLLHAEAPGVQVSILPCHALTSYYAEDSGLIIAY